MNQLRIESENLTGISRRVSVKTMYAITIIIFYIIVSIDVKAQIWEQTNGPFGGRIHALALHPSGDIYAGVQAGGLYCSTNEGDSWTVVGFENRSIDHVFISPAGYIFISTHYTYWDESGSYIWITESFRSTDNGNTWNLLILPIETNDSWAVDNNGNLYTAGWSGLFPSSNYTILKSTNEGETWLPWSYYLGGTPNDFLFFDSYIFMSDDSNGIFKLVNNIWVKYFPSQFGGLGTNSIERTSRGVLLAGTFDPDPVQTGQGIYRSVDSANTWVRIYSAGIENTYITSIIIDSNEDIFAGTSNGIFHSIDDGLTWQQSGLQNFEIRTIALTSFDLLIAGDDFGLNRWNELNQNWEEINSGLFVGKTFSLDIDRTRNIFFATTTAGLFRTSDNGNFWQLVFRGNGWGWDYYYKGMTFPLLFDNESGMVFFYDITVQKLYKSNDNGNTWETLSFPGTSRVMCLSSGLVPGEIFGGGINYSNWTCGAFFFSSNHGETWSQVLLNEAGGTFIQCLAVNQLSHYLFAGTAGSGIYRSTDNGLSWRSFNIGLLDNNILSIASDTNGYVFIGTQSGVFRSVDQGGNWSFAGLASDTILTIEVNSADNIFAGTVSGHIYKSTDRGNTWVDFSAGSDLSPVRCLLLNNEDFAMAGIDFKGVYRTLNSTVDISENENRIPVKYALEQNYPNPFNPSTRIKYSIPDGVKSQMSNVKLVVYDILGREIETLINEQKEPGAYELTWNAANLPSGVYFYQLKAGDYIETKKMLLLK